MWRTGPEDTGAYSTEKLILCRLTGLPRPNGALGKSWISQPHLFVVLVKTGISVRKPLTWRGFAGAHFL